MKTIYHKIVISPLYLIAALLAILTGQFKPFVTINIIIVVHELGHILMALYYHWSIKSIILFPFSGLIKFEEGIDHSLKEELLICLFGPIFQLLFWLMLYNKNVTNFNNYNIFLLSLNLLPIYPLDGAKILNVLLNMQLPFKASYKLTNMVSFFMIVELGYYGYMSCRYFLIFLGVFFWYKTYGSVVNTDIVFHKLLMEKVKDYRTLKPNIITNSKLEMIMIDRNNYFLVDSVLISESVFIKRQLSYLNAI